MKTLNGRAKYIKELLRRSGLKGNHVYKNVKISDTYFYIATHPKSKSAKKISDFAVYDIQKKILDYLIMQTK